MTDIEIKNSVHIIGGGLAGCEAAWQALSLGAKVFLYEMRPEKLSPAHKTGNLGELVCSNSFKSLDEASASGRLKAEMQALNSLVVESAHKAHVPAGAALAVDRDLFAKTMTKKLLESPSFTLISKEMSTLPSEEQMEKNNQTWVVATGPLTSDSLTEEIGKLCGGDERLYFYDAIAPIFSTDSIDLEQCFVADRYDKGDADYLNIPLNKTQYENFITDVENAEKMPLHSFEKVQYFESCLPIEVMVERGRETLRFGPMKPVGLTDPKTGERPWAVIQLRKENSLGTMYSLVGFQTKMKWPEQKRVFSSLPGLENVEFYRYGSIHRNTFVQSPKVLNENLSFKSNSRVFLAGQVTGVEGYTESAAIGLLAGHMAAKKIGLKSLELPPSQTLLGSLVQYVTKGPISGKFSPMNANLGLLPPIKKDKKRMNKMERKKLQCQISKEMFDAYLLRGTLIKKEDKKTTA